MNYCHLLLLLLCIIFIIYYYYEVENYCNIKTCKIGYKLENGKCVSCLTIPNKVGDYDKDCNATKCEIGYKLNSGKCDKCNDITGMVSNKYTESCAATECIIGYKLESGTCNVCKEIPGKIGDYGINCIATACDFNYNLINGDCKYVIQIANNDNFLNNNSSNNLALIQVDKNNSENYNVVINSTVSGSNLWSYTLIADCEYIITNDLSKKSLDAGADKDILNLLFTTDKNNNNQKWVLFKKDTYTYLYNRIKKSFLYFNGIKFYMSNQVLTDYNLKLPDNLNYNVVDDKKTIKNNDGKYLGVNNTSDFNLIFKDNIDLYSSWTIKQNTDNSYIIKNDISGQCLDYGRGLDQKVYLNNIDSNNNNMKWIFYDGGNSKIYIQAKLNTNKLNNEGIMKQSDTTNIDKFLFTIGNTNIIPIKLQSTNMISFNKSGINYYLSIKDNKLIVTNNMSTENEFQFIYKIVDTNYGYYNINSIFYKGKAIDIGNNNNLSEITTDNNNQKFQLNKIGDNKYYILSKENCKYLSINNKNEIEYIAVNNTDSDKNKEFTILSSIENNIKYNKYTINLNYIYNQEKYFLSATGNTTNNNKDLILMKFINNQYYHATSHWYIDESSTDGFFYIRNCANNEYLDVGNKNNNNDQLYEIRLNSNSNPNSSTHIRWKFHLINNKYYLFSRHHNGYLLFDVDNQYFIIKNKDYITNNNNTKILTNIYYYCLNEGKICSNNYDILAKYYNNQ